MFQLALDDSLASLRRKTDTPTDTNDLKRMANNNPMLEFLKEKYAKEIDLRAQDLTLQ